MGTRCITVFVKNEKDIAVLYRQFDGYPDGHGQELKEAFGGFEIVNGLRMDDARKIANGMSCLAAQVIAHFKKEPGGFYLYPAGTRGTGEEYVYTLYVDGEIGPLRMKVQSGAMTFFGVPGTPQAEMPVMYDGLLSDFRVKEETASA